VSGLHQFTTPIPVVTCDDQNGYAIYVRDGGTFENDVWCIALCAGGNLRHYTTSQLRIHQNMTFNIRKNRWQS
jgi:hypothetical protein